MRLGINTKLGATCKPMRCASPKLATKPHKFQPVPSDVVQSDLPLARSRACYAAVPGMLTRTAPEEQRAVTPLPIRFGRRLSSFPALIVALLVARVYWTCRDSIVDPDIWWHLRNAQYLLTNLHFPNVDTYSFTAVGSAWLNHEWLSEIFYYGPFSAFGLIGILVVFTVVLAVLVIAVFSLCMRESKDPFAAAIATIFGGLLAMVGFTPRTQNFGWLCFMGIYAILLRFRSTKDGPLWVIPVLFCLWINCHGTWLIGLMIYAVFVCAGLLRRDFGRVAAAPWTKSELKKLVATGFVSIAVLFANPFGYRLVLYPFDIAFRQNLNVANVEEWASVNFNDFRGKLVAVVLGAVFVMALTGRKRWRIDDALLTIFTLYCGLTHIRFLLLAGIVLPPILAPQFGRISSYDPRSERRLLNSVLLAIVAGACVFAFPSNRLLDSEIAGYFPVRAIQFLRTHPQEGHIFNVYQWGGYLEWNLPQIPTFIDSRTDIFEYKGVLKDYLNVITLSKSEEILDRHKINYVLYAADAALPYFLSKNSEWERIYSDGQAVIYRRLRTQSR